MCGIIGVVGADESLDILLDGLARLEYRGYDSAGVAIQSPDGSLWRSRAADGTRSVAALAERCGDAPRGTRTGIGHTRWATHGAPIERNAHPQVDCAGGIAVIHNGILENHAEIAERLRARGHTYASGTDTEVLAHLIEEHRAEGLELREAVAASLREVTGAFSVAVVEASTPGTIVAARRVSPLVVGHADGVTYLASDIPAILDKTRDLVAVEDDQLAVLTVDGVELTDLEGAPVEPTLLHVDWDVETAELGGHPDFMTKEVFEQPEAVRATLAGRRDDDGRVVLDEVSFTDEELASFERAVLVACGSSYHAAAVGRHAIEAWARLDCDVEIASEFRYRGAVLDERTLVIGVTQSGETIDTLQALREAKRRGARTLAVCNVVGASLAREADTALYTRAGPEIGVASTKTVLATITVLELLALRLAQARGTADSGEIARSLDALAALPERVSEVLKEADHVQEVANGLHGARDFFFIGRHVGFPVALEGALKLKELSYLHAEGYPAGELKHGPIALIEPGTVVVAIVCDPELREKVLSNIAEVKSRGASVVVLHRADDDEAASLGDWTIAVPPADTLLTPPLAIVPLQLLAYHLARLRGLDVDRPRNLAKTVTVE
jgi:glucosamine--fructose-6-phosphate aminotransferase (isomerizing)